ncbi:hypothetical protein GCM10010387_59400 [Streptomyces inusitatus]|uniref:Uncharacterized protein n=1 Tax=Streptomyces inusitatus TaxID=68221 RepID=A0A918QKT6_9ACTN|nr:hypothetical protein GCM10010387_59400 [Streptomyces inusitatus]
MRPVTPFIAMRTVLRRSTEGCAGGGDGGWFGVGGMRVASLRLALYGEIVTASAF